MDEMGLPPKSLRKNAPLKNNQAKMPKWFPNDCKYIVKDIELEQTKANKNKPIVIENKIQLHVPLIGSRQ